MRTRRARLLATTLALGALAAGCGGEAPRERTNVLFLLVEDQGAHLGRLGVPALETPRIDGLASEGVYLSQAFVASPVCSASKAALYTGRYPIRNGLRGNTVDFFSPAHALTESQRESALYRMLRIRDEAATLVEVLRDAGYWTGIVRKLHVAPNERFPFDRFLREAEGGAAIRAFIDEASTRAQPWLLVVSIRPPHRPFPNSDDVDIGIAPADVRLPGFLPDTAVVRQDWAEYLAAIEQADAEVGAALDALTASGAAPRTHVVLMSDHGPAFQRGKLSLHDFGLRVPLVFRGPGVRAGAESDALVSAVDVMPTLLDLLALPPVPGIDGRSFAGLLRGERPASGRALVFAELGHGVPRPGSGMQERSVFDGRMHLIARDRLAQPRIVNLDLRKRKRWGNRTYAETIRVRERFPDAYRILSEIDNGRLGGRPPPIELYDTHADPDELHDLAADPAHAEARARLLGALREHLIAIGDLSFRVPPDAAPAAPDDARPPHR